MKVKILNINCSLSKESFLHALNLATDQKEALQIEVIVKDLMVHSKSSYDYPHFLQVFCELVRFCIPMKKLVMQSHYPIRDIDLIEIWN